MSRFTIALAACVSLVAMAGCASKAETLGTLGGAAVGAAATGGSTIGTVAGGVVGYGAGKVYDDRHEH